MYMDMHPITPAEGHGNTVVHRYVGFSSLRSLFLLDEGLVKLARTDH